jgi:hypothetical protein
MLPKLVPNARILTYDWNANTFSKAAVEDLFGHARTFLRQLEGHRIKVRMPSKEKICLYPNSFQGPFAEAISLHRILLRWTTSCKGKMCI